MAKPPVNVILCGGGARFAALLGGYQGLEAMGFDVQRIQAISVGGLLAGPLAANMPSARVKHLALQLDTLSFMKPRTANEKRAAHKAGGILSLDRVLMMLDTEIALHAGGRTTFGLLPTLNSKYAAHLRPQDANRLTVRVNDDPHAGRAETTARVWLDQIAMVACDLAGGGGKHAATKVRGILKRLVEVNLPGDLATAMIDAGIPAADAVNASQRMLVAYGCGLAMAQPIAFGPRDISSAMPERLEESPETAVLSGRFNRLLDGAMPHRIPRDPVFYLANGSADPTPTIVFAMQQDNGLNPEQQIKQDMLDYPDKLVIRLDPLGVKLAEFGKLTTGVRTDQYDTAFLTTATRLREPESIKYLSWHSRAASPLYGDEMREAMFAL